MPPYKCDLWCVYMGKWWLSSKIVLQVKYNLKIKTEMFFFLPFVGIVDSSPIDACLFACEQLIYNWLQKDTQRAKQKHQTLELSAVCTRHNIAMGKLTNFHHLAFGQRFEINHLRSVKKRRVALCVSFVGREIFESAHAKNNYNLNGVKWIELRCQLHFPLHREIAAQLAY